MTDGVIQTTGCHKYQEVKQTGVEDKNGCSDKALPVDVVVVDNDESP